MKMDIKQGGIALISGVLFAVGLAVGGMTEPANVIGFLDVTGEWRPALAFVMMGAIPISAIAWMWGRRRGAPILTQSFTLPTIQDLDLRLLGGSALFGVGWGLGGFCPGPGIVATMSGSLASLVFVASMLAGTSVAIAWERGLDRSSAQKARPERERVDLPNDHVDEAARLS